MFELYSRRMKRQLQDQPEIYEYDSFSDEFRVQVYFILKDYISDTKAFSMIRDFFDTVYNMLLREFGTKTLAGNYVDEEGDFERFIETCTTEELLDLIDLSFNIIYENTNFIFSPIQEQADRSIEELNNRFRQHNIGYEFIQGQIVRKDNMYLHQEVIKPALKLLTDNNFSGAENEFLQAFDHRRKGENKEAILYALKSFESTMKTICDRMKYSYKSKPTAKDLVATLEENSFYPSYMSTHIASIRTALESGVPTLRNNLAGHGQGEHIVDVTDEFTEYALSLAASNMVFLMKLYEKAEKGR